jgi:hypothetical protein
MDAIDVERDYHPTCMMHSCMASPHLLLAAADEE